MPPMMLSKGITYVSNSVLTVRYRKMKENIALLSFKASHRSVRSAPSRRVYIWNPWWQVAEKLWNYIPIQKQMLCCSNLNCFSASGVKLGGWVFSWLLLVPWLMTRRMIPECITWTIRRVTKLKPSPSLCPLSTACYAHPHSSPNDSYLKCFTNKLFSSLEYPTHEKFFQGIPSSE